MTRDEDLMQKPLCMSETAKIHWLYEDQNNRKQDAGGLKNLLRRELAENRLRLHECQKKKKKKLSGISGG